MCFISKTLVKLSSKRALEAATYPTLPADQPLDEPHGVSPNRLGNGDEFQYIEPPFAALVLGHERLRPSQAVRQLLLSETCAFARFDHQRAECCLLR
jgi:hypothetical protein